MTDIFLTALAIVVSCGSGLIILEFLAGACERAMSRLWSDEAAEEVRKSRIGWWDR